MSRSRAAIFTKRITIFTGTAAIALSLPFLGATSASAGEDVPPPSTTATTDGHDWNN